MSDKDQIESGEVDPEVVTYQRKTDEQIADIAKAIYKNEIFPSWYIQPHDAYLVTSIFMPLIFVDTVTRKQWQIDGVEHFYANMSEAGPRSINGYPMFMGMSVLNLEDASRIHAKVQEIRKLLGD